MKVLRLLLPLIAVLFTANVAFAGMPVIISDPTGCNYTLDANGGVQFTVQPGATNITVCNNSANSYQSLNFTVSFLNPVNIGTMFCGGADDTQANPLAFDYCNVYAPDGEGGKFLLHQFVAANGDTPSAFYSPTPMCTFGCDGVVVNDFDTLVYLSFNLNSIIPIQSLNDPTPGAPGLLPGQSFNINFQCLTSQVGCDPIPQGGAGFGGQASTMTNTGIFPNPVAPVPEPATAALLLTVGLPLILRRVRKN